MQAGQARWVQAHRFMHVSLNESTGLHRSLQAGLHRPSVLAPVPGAKHEALWPGPFAIC